MKGFSSNLPLHAFMLEARIVYAADVALMVAETTTGSSDSGDGSDNTANDNTDATSVAESSDNAQSSENQTPQVSSEQNTVTGTGYSSYLTDDTWTDLTTGIDDVILSADGDYVYGVSYSSSVVSVFAVSDDGSLSLVQSIHSSALTEALSDGVSGVSQIEFSADQSQVFVYSETNQTLLTFSRASDTGELTYESVTDLSSALGSNSITSLQENNGYLYASAGGSLYVWQENDDGAALILVGSYSDGDDGITGISANSSLTFSADGSHLFVSGSGDNAVMSVFSVADDGTLTYTATISGSETYYINSLVSNADGSVVYAYQSNDDSNEIIVLSRNDDDQYEITATYEVDSEVSKLVLSNDASTLFTFGTDVDAYEVSSDGSLGEATSMNSDSAKISGGVTSLAYDTASNEIIAVTASTVSVFSYEVADVNFTEGGAAVAILPAGELSDSELDTLNDYQGASITITRDDGSDGSDDIYTLIADNGLTLTDDGNVELNGDVIASWSSNTDGLTITFTASVSQATAQQVLRQIAYSNNSDNPDANGSAVTLDITLNDGSGAESTLGVTLNLTDVNDAPLLSGDPQSISYTSGDDYVSLFSGVTVDSVESDNSIWKLTLTIDGASDTDVVNVDGNIITLTTTSGAPSTVNGLSYQVSESNGVKTLTVYIASNAASAAQTINNLSYRTTTEQSSGEVSFTLSVSETDGTTSVDTVTSTVNVSAQEGDNSATDIDASATDINYSEDSGSSALFSGVTISDSENDARNDGAGNYAGVTITVTTDGADTDGVISLVDNDTYTYANQQILKDGVVIASVTKNADGISITFTEAYKTVPTTADVNSIVGLIRYTNDAQALPDSADVSLTVTDDFGHVSDALVVTLAFSNSNDAPELSLGTLYENGELSAITSTDELTDVIDSAESVISSSGNRLFVADDAGNVAVYAVDSATGKLSFLALTSTGSDGDLDTLLSDSDGAYLYVIKDKAGSYSTYSEITVYSVGADGSLSEVQTVALSSDSYGFYSAVDNLTLSGDGSYLFFTYDYGMYSYQVDSDSHELGNFTTYSSAWGEPYIYQPTALTVSGDYVFVTTSFSSATLIAYKISDSGVEWVGYIRNGSTDSNGTSVSISSSITNLSSDGDTIYAATDSGISIYYFDSASNSFTAGAVVAIANIADTALAADGSVLYVTTTDSTLLRYAVSEGTLTLIDSTAISSTDATIRVTDSGSILVGDSDYTYYSVAAPQITLAPGDSALVLADVHVTDIDVGASGSYSGFVFTLSGSEDLSASSISVDSDNGYSAANGSITLNGEQVATYTVTAGQWVLTITGALSESQVNSLLQSIRYNAADSAQNGSQTLTLTAFDSENAAQAQSWDVNIVSSADIPVANVGDYALDNATADDAYSATLDDALVSDPDGEPLTWNVTGLPDGLKFDADTRTISGTPVSAGQYTLTVQVTNSSGESVSFELALTVGLSAADAAPQVVSPPAGLTAELGDDFSYQFSADSVTDPQGLDVTWSIDNLPQGLSFDASTLTLSGAAQQSGAYSLTVTVTNSLGLSTQFAVTLTMAASASSGMYHSPGDTFAPGTVPAAFHSGLTSLTFGELTARLSDSNAGAVSSEDWLAHSSAIHALSDALHTFSAQETVHAPLVSIDLQSDTALAHLTIVQVSLSNGQPLPAGVHFDAHHGELQVSADALTTLTGDKLSLLVTDSHGVTHQVQVSLSGPQPGASTSLGEQSRAASQLSVTQQAQAMLADIDQ